MEILKEVTDLALFWKISHSWKKREYRQHDSNVFKKYFGSKWWNYGIKKREFIKDKRIKMPM